MSVLVTIDHPWNGSFNYVILQAALRGLESAGHSVDLLDLQAENFNPVLSTAELEVYHTGKYLDPKIGEYQRRVVAAEHLVFIFPVWWEVMPARLKGWFDRVFLPEWAFAEADAAPLLTHIRTGTAITTMGGNIGITIMEKVGENFPGLLILDHRSGRDLDDAILAFFAVHVFTLTASAPFRLEM